MENKFSLNLDENNLKKILKGLYDTNHLLRNKYTGLYTASLGDEYVNYVWTRDVYYQVKPSLKSEPEAYIQTYRSLLDYFKGLNYKYDDKLNELIRKPHPINNVRFIHPRFYPDLTEITGNWGNLQLDTFGYFFLGLVEGLRENLQIIRDESDIEIVNKLVKVLLKIKYWTIEDNGIWEENSEIHASSIGAVVAGLHALEEFDFYVPRKCIHEGERVLKKLLPNESVTKDVDLALMTLIYPFNVLDDEMSNTIVHNIKSTLERDRGVIRYKNDIYYNDGGEAEWTFGFAYLFLYYLERDLKVAEDYLNKMINNIDDRFFVPELFFSNTDNANPNNPLGWSVAMYILSIEKYLEFKNKNK